VFQEIQDLDYPVVIADGGDFVPAAGDTHRTEIAEFLLEGLGAMAYDAIGVGELDLSLGPDYLRRASQKLPLVGANVHFGAGLAESLEAVRWVERKGRRIATIGVIDPILYYESPGALEHTDSLFVSDARMAIQNTLKGLKEKPDITVLLIHAERKRTEEILEGIDGLDIVVVGHDPLGPKGEFKIGNAFLVLPGPHSREVSLFTLTRSDAGSDLLTDLRVFMLSKYTKGDPKLEKMTNTFMAQHGMK
jgi:2',3'-cyclic-nucleotide 2'-phosphodiesterase (5'-nucleotidase family)